MQIRSIFHGRKEVINDFLDAAVQMYQDDVPPNYDQINHMEEIRQHLYTRADRGLNDGGLAIVDWCDLN